MLKRIFSFNFAYGVGAFVVIAGVAAKFGGQKWATPIIIVGLAVEAIIFLLSAFDAPEENYDWSLVYPELGDGTAKAKKKMVQTGSPEQSLSEKIDKMLADAKIDASVFEGLKSGVENLTQSVEGIASSANLTKLAGSYGEELGKATSNLESLNALYSVQLDQSRSMSESLTNSMKNSANLSSEFDALASNMNGLNKVYGGMLSAMNPNK